MSARSNGMLSFVTGLGSGSERARMEPVSQAA